MLIPCGQAVAVAAPPCARGRGDHHAQSPNRNFTSVHHFNPGSTALAPLRWSVYSPTRCMSFFPRMRSSQRSADLPRPVVSSVTVPFERTTMQVLSLRPRM